VEYFLSTIPVNTLYFHLSDIILSVKLEGKKEGTSDLPSSLINGICNGYDIFLIYNLWNSFLIASLHKGSI